MKASLLSLLPWSDRVVLEVFECLAKGHFDRSLVSPDFSDKHRAL